MHKDGSSVVSGLFWKFGESIAKEGVSFVISIILARLLLPQDYGGIALVNIFVTLANVFVVNGLGASLIQKKKADHLDFSSVFYLNLVFSLVLYLILFISAPFIQNFFEEPNFALVLRVIGLRIVFASVNSVQNAYVSRHMLFKRLFWVSLIGTFTSGVAGIVMAYCGFGIWALVTQILVGAIVNTIAMAFAIQWRPSWEFSWARVGGLFSYGWKLLASSLIKTGYSQLSGLIIGRVYSTEDLAYYTKGKKYPELITTAVDNSINTVLFPKMSKIQDDRERVKCTVRTAIRVGIYVMSPLLIGMAAIADPMIRLLLTEKWMSCVPYLRICAATLVLLTVQTANLQAIRALGRSDTILWLDIFKRGLGVVLLLVFIHQGVTMIALTQLIISIFATIVDMFPNRKMINYSIREQVKDILPGLLMSGAVGAVAYGCSELFMYIGLHDAVNILICILIAVAIYLGLSVATKCFGFTYIVGTLKAYLPKRERKTENDPDQK